MTVRAKMKLISITILEGNYKKYNFRAEYDNTIPEDKRFQKATPTATAEFMVDNPNVSFEVGKTYYFDMVPSDA